jgi:hypothetical protein
LSVDGSWGTYPREVEGSSFRVELGFHKLRVWLSGDDTPKVVKTEELQSAESRPDGSTKFAIRFKRDLIIPTSADESLKLVNAINALIDERRATELRDKQAAEALKQKLQKEKKGTVH